MSSGTIYNPDSFRQLAGPLSEETMKKIARLGMSPRQQELNSLWSYYCTRQYDARKMDWDGGRRPDKLEKEVIATAAFLPPGFYDMGGSTNPLPLKYRRPSAPYHLIRVIVNRFTGMLFSSSHHPRVEVLGDAETEDFMAGLVEASRLWPQMIQARTYGGAMGSSCIGFKFRDGQPEVEVHDPRWCKPRFVDQSRMVLSDIEIRYMYPVEKLDKETGRWIDQWYWYRRVIDRQRDVVYKAYPVEDGAEPPWDNLEEEVVEHHFGFCPVVWIQNLPVLDDIDGEPDCMGTYDMVDEIDALLSQANHGTISNCDPTLLLITDERLAALRKGSENAIKLPVGGSGSYLEISGSGITQARELAGDFRKYVLEVCQCVLDHPDVANRTATEIERVYGSMIQKADILQEQYGEKGVKPLLEMMLQASRQLMTPGERDGQLVKHIISLPPKVVDGQLQDRRLGKGKFLQLAWPPYFEASHADAQSAATAATTAKAGGLIDSETATKYVAPFFGIEDPQAVLEKVDEEQQEQERRLASSILGDGAGAGDGFSQ